MAEARLNPSGTITFLFTDIEGSTRLWEEHPEAMSAALAQHDALLRTFLESHEGHVFKTVGDAFCAAFASPRQALRAAVEVQQWLPPLQVAAGSGVLALRVRMALHSGTAEERDGDYFGPTLNRIARLLAAGHGGQVLVSRPARDLLQEGLPPEVTLRDLGSHRLRDLQQPERVFQVAHPELPAEFPPLRTLSVLPNNLPQQVSSFVGREREIADLRTLLGTSRLLTLTGSGGTGKTRLALQVGAELISELEHGAWLVELAALTDPALVPRAAAAALGVKEEPGRPVLQTLGEYVAEKRLLLILDNCEHQLAAAASLAEGLLQAGAGVRVLATSREALAIAGEQLYRVPSLTVPDLRRLGPADAEPVALLARYEALRLFTERAALVQPAFRLTAENAGAVTEICRRLDGIPLALELAAVRVKALSVPQLAARLDDRFRLLTGGSRTALPRQQTLRALIDWSYDLLSPPERTLLRRLSVFAGGWTLEAAEAVCAGDGVEDWEVLGLLTVLVEKSLVVYEGSEWAPRYRMLEMVRQYAGELLSASESAALRGRHRECFLHLAEQAEPELEGPAQSDWLERLEAEHDNLRGALGWSPDDAQHRRLAAALWRFWYLHAHYAEAEHWLAGALAAGERSTQADRARILTGAGTMAWMQGDYRRAAALHDESRILYEQLGDISNTAFALNNVAVQWAALCDYARAAVLTEESLALARQVNDQTLAGTLLCSLGESARGQGDFEKAERLYEESLALARAHGNAENCWMNLFNLGCLAVARGDARVAGARYRESLDICLRLGNQRGIDAVLAGFGAVWVLRGYPDRAARLFGAAEAVRDAVGLKLEPVDARHHDQQIARVRAALGEAALAARWADGRAVSVEQAVEMALAEEADG